MGASKPLEEQSPPSLDENENPNNKNDDEEPMWKRDPEETFSDWTIEIVTFHPGSEGSDTECSEDSSPLSEGSDTECSEELSELSSSSDWDGNITGSIWNETVSTYHVHKCVLAVGRRKSDYFTRLFRATKKGEYNESSRNSSRIELDPLEAAAFPAFLDYAYAPNKPLEVATHSATALHSLGEYFDNAQLRRDVREFCLEDVSLGNLDYYYEHASLLQNQGVLEVVAGFVGKNLLRIAPSSTILEKAEPSFWIHVLWASRNESSDKADNEASSVELSRHWSMLMSEVGKRHVESLDKGTFEELTNETAMPHIHEDAALRICEADDRLHSRRPEAASFGVGGSPLQERCVASMAKTWKDFSPDDEEIALEQRDVSFLASLVRETVRQAKADVEAQAKELEQLREKVKKFKALPEANIVEGYYSTTIPIALQKEYPELACTRVSMHRDSNNSVHPVFYYDARG